MEATIVLAKPLNETQCNASYSGISEYSLTMGKYLPCFVHSFMCPTIIPIILWDWCSIHKV